MSLESDYDYLLEKEIRKTLKSHSRLPDDIARTLRLRYGSSQSEVESIMDEDEEYTFSVWMSKFSSLYPECDWTEIIVLRGACICWYDDSLTQPYTKSIKRLIDSIFRYYEGIESRLTTGEKSYITRQEFDANNATRFEELSNAFLVGIKTKLSCTQDFFVLMICLESIITENFFLFEDLTHVSVAYEEQLGENIPDEDIQKLLELDVQTWTRILGENTIHIRIDLQRPLEQYDNLLRNRHGKLVNPGFADFTQKYFRISELHSGLKFRPTIS
jgi:hypothetical protein